MFQDHYRGITKNSYDEYSTSELFLNSKQQSLIVPKKYCKKHKKSQFQDNQIFLICKNQTCKNNRFCCLQCVDQSHKKHPLISFKKFNTSLQRKLYHNVMLKDKKKIFSVIENSHQKFTQKFAQIKIQLNKLLYEIEEQIEKVYQNIYGSFCTTDYESVFNYIYSGDDGSYSSEAVNQYIQRMENNQNYLFSDAQNTQMVLKCTIQVMEKKFLEVKKTISIQVSKIKDSLKGMRVASLSRQQFNQDICFDKINRSSVLGTSDSKRGVHKNPGANTGGFNVALLNHPLDPVNNSVSFRITRQGQMRQCVIGVCVYEIAKNFAFQNIQGLNRGSYAIDQRNFSSSSAYTWNSHDSSFNNKPFVGFNFQVGQIITVEVDFCSSQVIFRKGQSQYRMPIKLTLGTLYAFASPCTSEDSIQITSD